MWERKKIRVLSVGKPYVITGEELCKKQDYFEIEVGCRSRFYFDDASKAKGLKTDVVAVSLVTNFSMIQNAGYTLRECSFIQNPENSKHAFYITALPFERANSKKGYFVLNINKFKELDWLDKDNLLTKSICVSPPFGSKYYKEKHEIDAVALKAALDEIDTKVK
jgi:hypothetical protein